MNRCVSFLIFIWIASAHISQAQEKYTNANTLELILTSDRGSLKLHGNDLIAAYDPALECFFLQITRGELEPEPNPDHDQGLSSAFQDLPDDLPFIIRIYVENDPLDLNEFEGKNKSLPASIEFGEFCFEDKANTSGLISGDDLILGFSIESDFYPPLYLVGNTLIPINHIRVFSDQVEIYGFLNHLND